MTERGMEDRLGAVEREQARFGEQLGHVRGEVHNLADGVRSISSDLKKLVEHEARRPEPMGLKTVVATLGSVGSVIAMMAFFSWWFIATSPTVMQMERRLDKLDDPAVGRVPRLEREQAWTPQVRVK